MCNAHDCHYFLVNGVTGKIVHDIKEEPIEWTRLRSPCRSGRWRGGSGAVAPCASALPDRLCSQVFRVLQMQQQRLVLFFAASLSPCSTEILELFSDGAGDIL